MARPVLTLRLRLTLLYGGLLAVVAATLLGAAVIVLDRALRALPQFPPGVRLDFSDGSSLTAAEFSQLVRDSARGEFLVVLPLAVLLSAKFDMDTMKKVMQRRVQKPGYGTGRNAQGFDC